MSNSLPRQHLNTNPVELTLWNQKWVTHTHTHTWPPSLFHKKNNTNLFLDISWVECNSPNWFFDSEYGWSAQEKRSVRLSLNRQAIFNCQNALYRTSHMTGPWIWTVWSQERFGMISYRHHSGMFLMFRQHSQLNAFKELATPYRLFHHRLLITVVILTNRSSGYWIQVALTFRIRDISSHQRKPTLSELRLFSLVCLDAGLTSYIHIYATHSRLLTRVCVCVCFL